MAPALRVIRGGLAPARHVFLLLHRKGLDDAALTALHRRVAATLLPAAQGRPFAVVTAKQDYTQNFERLGGWEGWIQGIVGREYTTGDWKYTGFIVAGEMHGSATARIIKLALVRGAPVELFDPESGTVRAVHYVEHAQGPDWRVV